jgi:tyrosyl-tRNA synthetase
MFGKLMSVSDELMWRYFELLSFRPMNEIERLKREVEQGANPRDIKFQLGREIVARFHDEAAAGNAQANFVARFQQGALPDEMPEVTLASQDGNLGIASLLKGAELTGSTSEAFRMIKQGAVRIDGVRIQDRDLAIEAGNTHVFQVGKRRFARVTVT